MQIKTNAIVIIKADDQRQKFCYVSFRYTKVNRDDDTWTHQLELNWVKVENLLTDNFYQVRGMSAFT